MSDSYQPPSQPGTSTGVSLYSVRGIVIGTIVGTLPAGIVMMFLNYRALGRNNLAKTITAWGTAVFIMIMVIASFIPPSDTVGLFLSYGLLFTVIQAVIAYFLADRLQGAAIRYHQENSGAMYSSPRAAAVGFLTGFILMFVMINVMAILGGAPATVE